MLVLPNSDEWRALDRGEHEAKGYRIELLVEEYQFYTYKDAAADILQKTDAYLSALPAGALGVHSDLTAVNADLLNLCRAVVRGDEDGGFIYGQDAGSGSLLEVNLLLQFSSEDAGV